MRLLFALAYAGLDLVYALPGRIRPVYPAGALLELVWRGRGGVDRAREAEMSRVAIRYCST